MLLEDYRNERLKKLEALREQGIEPYPSKSNRNSYIADVVNHFDEKQGQEVCVAGRIVAIRSFGKLVFLKLRDASAEVQIFMKASSEATPKALLGAKEVKLLDTGDFIEAKGIVDKSQTGEISVFADFVRLLTKTLRPLPEKFTNKEERYRRRYVDMNVNPEVRERLVRRSRFWQATRDFMNKHGFIEVNIPVLEHTTGGADANPFVTHMDALNEDFYLRISHELPLKRLLGGGFEKVYDIGPRFRNEGIDDEHLPEHIAFEAYAAYENYEDGMKFYEEMIKYVCKETWGTLQFEVGGFKIDLDCEWPRVRYADLLSEKYGVDVFNPDREQIIKVLLENWDAKDLSKEDFLKKLENTTTPHLIDDVWKLIRKTSPGPYWVIEEPLSLSPLAKKSSENPLVTE
ncbi:lysine--tRNA ligase, partial [Candidatus Saccharibacteria bacterium]|nr:lysine--tRNA ligase [Candidatus Saccharibacteria bacterium]